MTDLEIRILSNLVKALPSLNENAKYRLLGYGEGLADRRENEKIATITRTEKNEE